MSKEPLRLTLEAIARADFFRDAKLPQDVGSINELDETQFRKGVMNCVFSGRKGIPQDLVTTPQEAFDGYVSSFSMDDGVVRGLFLVRKNEAGELEIVLLQAIGKDAARRIGAMLKEAFFSSINLYPAATVVVIPQNTPEAEMLAKKLFAGRN